jgi:predicted enzyme related to lactoylglutathione lyase
MAATVTHFEIYGEQPDALADFYRGVFEWTIDRAPGLDYFRVDTGTSANGLRGGLTHRPIDALRSWVHYVAVDSVAEAIDRTVALGGTVLVNRSAVPKTAWYAVLADPEGNAFAVWQADPNAWPDLDPEL